MEDPILPETAGRTLVTDLPWATHLGSTQLSEMLKPRYVIPRLDRLMRDVSARCQIWAQVNPENPYLGRGKNVTNTPVNSGKTDFTKIQSAREG